MAEGFPAAPPQAPSRETSPSLEGLKTQLDDSRDGQLGSNPTWVRVMAEVTSELLPAQREKEGTR